jgi:hypothetical protein
MSGQNYETQAIPDAHAAKAGDAAAAASVQAGAAAAQAGAHAKFSDQYFKDGPNNVGQKEFHKDGATDGGPKEAHKHGPNGGGPKEMHKHCPEEGAKVRGPGEAAKAEQLEKHGVLPRGSEILDHKQFGRGGEGLAASGGHKRPAESCATTPTTEVISKLPHGTTVIQESSTTVCAPPAAHHGVDRMQAKSPEH